LIEALERISIFNTETQRCTYLVFGENELVLYSQGQDTGEANETLPVQFQGNIEKIIYPTRNLMEVLNHFDSSQLTFEFTNSNGPCKVTGDEEEDSNYLVIIMPVEIEEETYYSEEVVD
ncbi:MAG: DNA polymerase III subunit beta, partial [Thermodesulfobacteriota bacterium]